MNKNNSEDYIQEKIEEPNEEIEEPNEEIEEPNEEIEEGKKSTEENLTPILVIYRKGSAEAFKRSLPRFLFTLIAFVLLLITFIITGIDPTDTLKFIINIATGLSLILIIVALRNNDAEETKEEFILEKEIRKKEASLFSKIEEDFNSILGEKVVSEVTSNNG